METIQENVTAWVTKYALTTGIVEVVGTVCCDDGHKMLRYKREGYTTQYAHGKDWHTDLRDALWRAQDMRAAKIASLRKQIDRLMQLDFDEAAK